MSFFLLSVNVLEFLKLVITEELSRRKGKGVGFSPLVQWFIVLLLEDIAVSLSHVLFCVCVCARARVDTVCFVILFTYVYPCPYA